MANKPLPLTAQTPDDWHLCEVHALAQAHEVDPAQADFLAAGFAGPVERVALERSYHVATMDYDKDLVFERSVAFGLRVAGR